LPIETSVGDPPHKKHSARTAREDKVGGCTDRVSAGIRALNFIGALNYAVNDSPNSNVPVARSGDDEVLGDSCTAQTTESVEAGPDESARNG
jgi:hypothetical protein